MVPRFIRAAALCTLISFACTIQAAAQQSSLVPVGAGYPSGIGIKADATLTEPTSVVGVAEFGVKSSIVAVSDTQAYTVKEWAFDEPRPNGSMVAVGRKAGMAAMDEFGVTLAAC